MTDCDCMPVTALHRINEAAIEAWDAGLGVEEIVGAIDIERGMATARARVAEWAARSAPPQFEPLPPDPEP